MPDPTSPGPRPRPTARLVSWTALAMAGALAGGCGGDATPGGAADPGVVIDGSSTVYQISRVAAEEFNQVDDKVEVVVGKSGTGGGFGKYLHNEVDIVDASRAAKPDEEAKAREQGLDWSRFLVGYDGITVVVHPKNTFVKELGVDQLKKLWAPDSQVKTWKDLDGSWPDRPITLFSPDNDSGTFDFFTEAIVGKAKSQRSDVQVSSDDNTLVRGVSGADDGIGYFGYSYYQANAERLRAVPIRKDKDAPAVMPDPASILSKAYAPLSRPLYIYVKRSAMRRAGAAAFVRFYLEKVESLATKAGYVAPTAEDIEANKKTLGAAGGPSA